MRNDLLLGKRCFRRQHEGETLASRKKLISEEEERRHFERFFLVGSVLFIYLIVKLKIFLGKFNREDQIELSFGKECDMTVEKKEPWETRLDVNLSFFYWNEKLSVLAWCPYIYRTVSLCEC